MAINRDAPPLLVRVHIVRGPDLFIDTNGMAWDGGRNESGWTLVRATPELVEEAVANTERDIMRRKLWALSRSASITSLMLALLQLNFDKSSFRYDYDAADRRAAARDAGGDPQQESR